VTWDGFDYWCDNCRCRVSGKERDPVCDSLTYAPGIGKGYDLCEPCSREEEAEEEKLGTNVMPHRAKRYAANRAKGYHDDE
jgi:hypothetical protein